MRVSVCMAVYNGEKFLREQIDSILPQLRDSDELIISDDGSTDATLDILHGYEDDRISIIESNGKNIIKNFENALRQSSGDVVFLADQDDIWKPDKVEKCLEKLKKYDLVFSNVAIFNEDISTAQPLYPKGSTRTGIVKNLVKNNYIGATMAFRKGILLKALPFPDGIYMHDIWLAMTAEIIGKTYYFDEALVFYRRHGENASQTGEKSSNSLDKKIRMRAVLVNNLFKRFL